MHGTYAGPMKNRLTLVQGQAGTGKTTRLIDVAREQAPLLVVSPSQTALAITRMHGARRRLHLKLSEGLAGRRFTVTTIDAFALSIVNRWRTVLGYTQPVVPVRYEPSSSPTLFGTELSFASICRAASNLLKSPTVARLVGYSHPLIVIDEFQDCQGELLDFVAALAPVTTLLLAADDFQFLDGDSPGCPATDWAKRNITSVAEQITQLNTVHRTSNPRIMAAARALRSNVPAASRTVPVYSLASAALIAWRIIERMVFGRPRWHGATALICPSHDPLVDKVLASCDSQLRKRNCSPLEWDVRCSAEENAKAILPGSSVARWGQPGIEAARDQVLARAARFARLKGITAPSDVIVARHAEMVAHERTAYRPTLGPRLVTTIHGAKNLEFDNVFVLWPYRLPPGSEIQRRLLYNAITRAKQNCTVLVLGKPSRVQACPVLSLLGPAQAT